MKKWLATVLFLFAFSQGSQPALAGCENCVTLIIRVKMQDNAPWPPPGVWATINSRYEIQLDATGYGEVSGLPTTTCPCCQTMMLIEIKGYMREMWSLNVPRCGKRHFNAVLTKCGGGWINHTTGTGMDIPPDECFR